jgi:CheY-like chemotaxis protein
MPQPPIFRRLSLVLAVIGGLGPFSPFAARAQPAPGVGEAGPPAAADPFGGGAPKAADSRAAAPPPDVTAREPLVIELLRASNPATPLQLVAAAETAWRFERLDDAKRYLARLVTDKPSDEALAALTPRYTDLLMSIGRAPELQPEGRQAADAVFFAAQRRAQDPARLSAFVKQLSDPGLGTRQTALAKLAEAGPQAVAPLLAALADASRAAEHVYVQAALVRLRANTEMPLLGALETPNDGLKARIIEVLGHMGSSRAAVYLVRPALDAGVNAGVRHAASDALRRISGTVPDLYEAERFLLREIDRFQRGDLLRERTIDDDVALWTWDQGRQTVVSVATSREDAGTALAARLADDLAALKIGDRQAARRALLLQLEVAKIRGGLGQPLVLPVGFTIAAAMENGPLVNEVLADALAAGRIPAAIAAAELLGRLDDASVLESHSSSLSPLAEAMTFPDRRVRFAAAMAAVRLAPGKSFSGASRVAMTLGRLAAGGWRTVVLVGHPQGETAQTLVGLLNGLGYDGEVASTGRAAAERAFANPDLELALLSDAIDSPPVEEVVQWLRRDYRTARLPIGVMARSERLEKLRDFLADDRFTVVFPRPQSLEVITAEVQQVRGLAGRNIVGLDERQAQAQAAITALANLATNNTTLAQYELLRQEKAAIEALANPVLSQHAAALLAVLGTPRAQASLVEFALQGTSPLGDRTAAAKAFVAAVVRRGLGLTPSQIALEHDRYAAGRLDEPTRNLLAMIMEAIDGPTVTDANAIPSASPVP